MAGDVRKLKTELDAGHPVTGPYNANAQLAANEINEVNVSMSRTVSVQNVRQYLSKQIDGTGAVQRSSLDMIREYAVDGTVRGVTGSETAPDARRSAANMIWFMLGRDPADFYAVDDENIQANFVSLGPDGGNGPTVLTGTQLNAIDALASETVSQAVNKGLGRVGAGLVIEARNL